MVLLGCSAPAGSPATDVKDVTTDGTTSDVSLGQARARELEGKTAVYDNGRCYSAVSYWHGMLGAPIDIGTAFLSAWMKSPLVTRIDGADLRPGDVIALGAASADGVPTDHVAVVNRDGEIFQKAGSPTEFPFETLTLDAFESRYAEDLPTARFYRPNENLDARLTRNGDVAAKEMSEKLATLEKRLGAFIVVPIDFDGYTAAWSRDFQRADDEVTTEAAALEAEIQGSLDASDETSKWAWNLLLLRAQELQRHEGPYD